MDRESALLEENKRLKEQLDRLEIESGERDPIKEEFPKPDRLLKIDGRSQRCSCSCNVFREHVTHKGLFKCNACDALYEGFKH